MNTVSEYVALEAERMMFVYMQSFLHWILSRKVNITGSEVRAQSQSFLPSDCS